MRNIELLNNHGNDALRVSADYPSRRGMPSHRYVISGFDTSDNGAARSGGFIPRFQDVSIILQSEGAANDLRPDGVSSDALLAIVEDHLSGLQGGPDASLNKQLAIEYISHARQLLAEEAAAQSSHYSNSTRWGGSERRVGGHHSL
jgi:hypothetical protein